MNNNNNENVAKNKKNKDKFSESMAYFAFVFIVYGILVVFGILLGRKAANVMEADDQRTEYIENIEKTEGMVND